MDSRSAVVHAPRNFSAMVIVEEVVSWISSVTTRKIWRCVRTEFEF